MKFKLAQSRTSIVSKELACIIVVVAIFRKEGLRSTEAVGRIPGEEQPQQPERRTQEEQVVFSQKVDRSRTLRCKPRFFYGATCV